MAFDLPLADLFPPSWAELASGLLERFTDVPGIRRLLALGLTSLFAIHVTSTLIVLVGGLKRVHGIAGLKRPFFPYGIPGLTFPTSYVNPGYYFLWLWRATNYKRFNSEIFSFVGLLSGSSMLFTNNLDIARQVAGGSNIDWEKPLSHSVGVLIWGMNVLAATGGAEWRKHRRIMGPAFNNDIYRAVWKKAIETYRVMLANEGWEGNKVNQVDSVRVLTTKFALLVFGTCGFGIDFNWSDPELSSEGDMSLHHALDLVNNRQSLQLVPEWIKRLPIKFFTEYREAKATVDAWLRTQIAERKELVRGHTGNMNLGKDCFTYLVKANEDEGKIIRLTDEELMGNIFVLLVAGHETTAHSLAATLAHLALDQDVQNEVLEQIIEVVGWDREPVFEDYNSLNKVLSAFYESLRMYPTVHIMFRETTSDTVLRVPKPPGEEGYEPLPLSKGTLIVVDMVGLQYNERYFDEPEKYKPSRWYGMPNDSETVSAFSIGPRACIGRKFATSEVVPFLTLLLRDWKVEPLLRDGETIDQWKAKVFDTRIMMTLGVKDVPLRFARRERA